MKLPCPIVSVIFAGIVRFTEHYMRKMSYWKKMWEWFSMILFLGGVGCGAYYELDNRGYIPHSVETSISARPTWFVGEKRQCYSIIHSSGYVADPIYCGDGPYHQMTVKLYGRLYQPEHTSASWRCTREAEDFTCHQNGAQ
jgi:hypothetical protein